MPGGACDFRATNLDIIKAIKQGSWRDEGSGGGISALPFSLRYVWSILTVCRNCDLFHALYRDADRLVRRFRIVPHFAALQSVLGFPFPCQQRLYWGDQGCLPSTLDGAHMSGEAAGLESYILCSHSQRKVLKVEHTFAKEQ